MNQELRQAEVQITPLAILAAILYNADKVARVKVQADDGSGEIEQDLPVVQIEKDGENLVCILPMQNLLHFVQTTYNMRFSVARPKELAGDDPTPKDLAVIGFERAGEAAVLLNGHGKKIATNNPTLNELMAKLGL